MIDASTNPHSFLAHFIRIEGPESDPTVRVLLVEASAGQTIYEGFGTWPQCRRWIALVSTCGIFADQFASIERLLQMKRLATIKEFHVSTCDLESFGFRRAY